MAGRKGTRQKMVVILETQEVFPSLTMAASSLGIDVGMLSAYFLHNKRVKNLDGLTLYTEEYPAGSCVRCGGLLKKNKQCKRCVAEYGKAYIKRTKRRPRFRVGVCQSLYKRDKDCKLCGKVFGGGLFEIDHILPKSRGGSSELDNLQLLCPACNKSKHNMTTEEYVNHCKVVYLRSLSWRQAER